MIQGLMVRLALTVNARLEVTRVDGGLGGGDGGDSKEGEGSDGELHCE